LRWILRIGAGILLALGFSVTAFASTVTTNGTTPQTAVPVSSSMAASGSLTGLSNGAFSYYTFDYPGDGSVGTLTIDVSPVDPTTLSSVGVTLWQAGTELANMNSVGPTPGANAVTFSSTTKGPVLVQVYNYLQGEPVSFHLAISGVTQPAAAPMQPPMAMPNATPAAAAGTTAANPIHLTRPVSGTLAGNVAGSFAFYTADYPGDGSQHNVTFSFSPAGADVSNALVVNVYQNGTLLATAQGSQAATLGQLTVPYSSTTAGSVLIQIGNYNPSPTVSYTISD